MRLDHPDALYECVERALIRSVANAGAWARLLNIESKYPRRLGSVSFITADRSKGVHFHFDEYALAPCVDNWHFSNDLTIEWIECEPQGEKLAEIAHAVARKLFDNELFDHGHCWVAEQYDAKNLDRTGGGVRAVGIDVSKGLPGFYWGNYFGPFLCDRIGKDKLAEVPGCRSERLQSGYLVTNQLPPDAWNTAEFLRNENEAMDHIGRSFFFEKGKPMTGSLFPIPQK